MVELSVAVEGLFGLTWPDWKRLVPAIEALGFAGLYVSDHFILPAPVEVPALEAIVALTYAADHTERVRLGPMVSPLSVRDPAMLARQAAALDDLSGGRFVLGVGAGWMAREHDMFGYELGDVPTRLDRLGEGLAVIASLFRADGPVSFDGQHFRLSEAVLPGPRRAGGPSLLVGASGPRRGLPLVARYADIWNVQLLSPEAVAERSALLDQLIKDEGRQPADVRRTLNAPVICWRTPAEREARLRGFRVDPDFTDLSDEQLLDTLHEWFLPIVGTPDEVVAQIRAYGEVGISEVTVQWFGMDDLEGLELLATEVLPRVG
jgi:alkanesulfonate monooxygenase SsuD/methylene tetrahydromethanopterin reductase-like flavin-dependent oxidoreductase (luciferase family)